MLALKPGILFNNDNLFTYGKKLSCVLLGQLLSILVLKKKAIVMSGKRQTTTATGHAKTHKL